MQLKITTVVAGETLESAIAVKTPEAGPQEAFQRNSTILQAVSGQINLHQGQKIDSLKVEVID